MVVVDGLEVAEVANAVDDDEPVKDVAGILLGVALDKVLDNVSEDEIEDIL